MKKKSEKCPIDDDSRVRLWFYLFGNGVLMCQQRGTIFFAKLCWMVLSCDLIIWTFLGPPLTLCDAWWKAVGCFWTWMEPVVEHTFYKQSVSLGKDSSVYRWMTFWAWVRNTCEPWKSVMNNYVGFGFPIYK